MNNEESITTRVELTEKEYVFLSLYMKIRSTAFVLICFFFLYIAVFYVLIKIPLLMNIIISAVLILFIILPIIFFVLSYRARKEYRSNYSLRKEVIIKFSDLGFDLTTENSENHREWTYLYSIRELKYGFVFYYSAYTATLFPKRCFDSKKDIDFFKDLVSNHLDSNKVHFRS
ncbi:YcxB family protein [Desemzia sp. FAM 24101]|uniref:YcxB family protein n=1 Tax=unclassified Desemzia TaxID=2685243 RepID=UPI003889B437